MKSKLASAILIQLVCLVTVSHTQQSNPIADPEAERTLDKAAQAEGGDRVLGALRTLRLTGSTYNGSSSFLLSDVESIVKFPDKFRDTFWSIDGNRLGYGFDGTEAWKRLPEGVRSTGLPILQVLLPAAQWRLRYTRAKFVGQRKVGKKQAYVIRALVHGQTSPADYYYDAATYLLLQVDTAAEGLAVTYRLSSYQDVGGLKVPREWGFGESRAVVAKVKLNVDIDDAQFARLK